MARRRWPTWAERKAARARAEEIALAVQARGPVTPPAEELAQVALLLESASWKFAKSMPKNPHFYTLRKHWTGEGEFLFVVERINAWGFIERWPSVKKGWPYVCLDLEGFHYWPMGEIADCELINRKPIAAAAAAIAAAAAAKAPPVQPTLFDLENDK